MNLDELDTTRNQFRASLRRAQATIAMLKNREEDDAALQRLAELSPVKYDRIRKVEAKNLKIKVSTLDREVEKRRPREPVSSNAAGRKLSLPDIDPFPQPVDGAVLFSELVSTIKRYVSLPRHAADAVVFWSAWSFLIDRFDIAPRLALLSPEKRCGKTTLLEILSHVSPRPLLVSGITPSAIFRTIESARPTLLIDEADTFTKENEELRGVLNSGHTRASATIIRTCGDDYEPRAFSTWCPMVLAAIGALPGTVEDRSISISMQRKSPGEPVTPFPRSGKRAAALRAELQTLARKIRRWTDDHAGALAEAEPTVPIGLHDRATDNWRPLLAIADEIGGEWPNRARDAAVTLSEGASKDSETVKVRLLADIREILKEKADERLTSVQLCEALAALEERPWADWRRGQAITPAQLARLLRPFGVSSRTIRQGGNIAKGYLPEDFGDAFSRYLPDFSLLKRYNVTTRSSIGDSSLFQNVTGEGRNVSQNATIPAPGAVCDGVTFQNHELGEEETFFEVGDAY